MAHQVFQHRVFLGSELNALTAALDLASLHVELQLADPEDR
jgi:hypothetical protein